MRKIRMPSPAENVDAVTLAAWRLEPGATVRTGDELADLVTEKAAFPLTAEMDGVLTHRLATPGSVLPPGFVLALLDADDDDVRAVEAENDARLADFGARGFSGVADRDAGRDPTAAPAPVPPAGAPVRATPAARRLARELGVSLETVAAAHPPGTLIREEQVRACAR